MDLEASLAEAKLAVDYFFNNKFAEAKDLMKPWWDTIWILYIKTNQIQMIEIIN